MILKAYKYQGAGNDFIIVDNRDKTISLGKNEIRHICDRRFGIGGDGFMMLLKSNSCDFAMKYFNSDGNEGTMCGNGGRCLVAFAAHRGLKCDIFEAADGIHRARIVECSSKTCVVELGMINVDKIAELSPKRYFLNTGSPHLVIFVDNLKDYDVHKEGRLWRNHSNFPEGTNVCFVQGNWGKEATLWNQTMHSEESLRISVRTYERGVEDETFSCGTGVVASAIAYYKLLSNYRQAKSGTPPLAITAKVKTLGGELNVDFKYSGDDRYTDILLTGPATFVYTCEMQMESSLF